MERGIAFDLLQFPYNLFDRQFEPYLASLHQSGVEIHTRSVFLQGLFFKDLATLGSTLEPLRPYLATLRKHCSKKERSLEQLALGFVANSPFVDGILIGVDSVNQLQDNIRALNTPLDESDLEFIHSLNIKETELLNPVNWK
jgi:aryl-alcohol dehydrogenase-like predicted oxidoreductase